MKKRMMVLLTLLLTLGVVSTLEATVSFSTVDVTWTALFDEHNVNPVEVKTINAGHRLQLASSLASLEGYAFSFWVVNGVVDPTRRLDHELSITQDTHLQAVFSPADKHAAVFVDDEGALLDYAYLSDGDNAVFTGDVPAKPGYTLADPMWDNPLDSIQQDTLFTLQYDAIDEGDYTLDVDANIAGEPTGVSEEGPYEPNQPLTLTAESVTGYDFLYWQDMATLHALGTSPVLEYTVHKDAHVRAIYQAEATTAYATGFESAAKSSYAMGSVTVDGESWFFYEALIGSLSGDRKTGSQSVRIRAGGFIHTEFSVQNPTRLSFDYGTYGTDIELTFHVQFSTNALSWHTLDTVISPAGSGLHHFSYDIDLMTLRETHGIDENTEMYFRLHHVTRIPSSGTSNERLNIDNVHIDTYTDFVGFPLLDTESDVLDFSFDRALLAVYSLHDTWSPAGCEALDAVLGALTCSVDGVVDTTTRGVYTITYTATDHHGTMVTYQIDKTVLNDASLLDMVLDDYDGYYANLEGLFGEALLLSMRALLWDDVLMPTYDDIRDILQISDEDPSNPDNVLQIYTGQSVIADWDSRQWDREHIWPNSRLGVMRAAGTMRHAGTDAHNLRPINASINIARGNKYFDTNTTTDGYYPDDDHGNVARTYFYLAVKYDWLTLSDALPPPDSTYAADGAYQGYLSVLITWHFEDSVSAFEQHRNDVIYSYQNNRNPFIDYPHLVELIWFDHDNIEETPEP